MRTFIALMLAAITAAPGAQEERRVLRASELIGMQVINSRDESLGEISELVINVDDGTVHHAVLDFGGWLGLGEKIFPYPTSALRPAPGEKLLLHLDRESLERAPSFDAARLIGNRRLMRATQLMDKEVRNRQGAEIGEIEDLLVDLDEGTVRYAVVEVEAGPAREEAALVPPHLISRGPGEDLWLEMDAGVLRQYTR